MLQKVTKFTWNKQRVKAAMMVSQDVLTDEQIAHEAGVERMTLSRWKKLPAFKKRVDKIVAEIQAKLIARGIAEKQNRIDALNDRWGRMKEVIVQRAVEHEDVRGGETGLLVKQVKGIGSGNDFQVVEEYAVDTGLLKEMREHEKQAAQEMGEWTEKRELTGKDGAQLFQNITVEILDGSSNK